LKNIVLSNICKQHKKKNILENITFKAKEGRITAFLGPNGAGKSSTLRILLGLDLPLSGTATFGKKKYSNFIFPLQIVGSAFDGIGGTPSRKVKTHLKIIAKSNNIPNKRISEVLGDPQYLVLDEPTNGLDPMGIKWFRNFIRRQADQGKTVLLSSHYLSEIEAIADDVVIINKGQIVVTGELHEVMQNIETLEDVFFLLTEGGN